MRMPGPYVILASAHKGKLRELLKDWAEAHHRATTDCYIKLNKKNKKNHIIIKIKSFTMKIVRHV